MYTHKKTPHLYFVLQGTDRRGDIGGETRQRICAECSILEQVSSRLLIRKLLSQTLVLSPENQRLQLLFLVRLVAAIN